MFETLKPELYRFHNLEDEHNKLCKFKQQFELCMHPHILLMAKLISTRAM